MQYKLREYQQELLDKINNSTDKRNCVQAPTGFGKTVLFTAILNAFKGRALVLVNRTELVAQTVSKIDKSVFKIVAGVREIKLEDVNIGMAETVYNRIKKGKLDVNDFDLIITDEVHNLQFNKIYDGYKGRLLGFTATPLTMKRETFFVEDVKHIKSISLSQWYGPLICGVKISELVQQGYLTPVKNYVIPNANLSKLKTDKSGEFTSKSQSDVFDNQASIKCLYDNYNHHCKGQKTMVFNSNTKTNADAYDYFLSKGVNCRSYDSKSLEDRKDIVEWFRNTPDAVLFSVGVFTTGFDVDDVENIILNRATKSLSLYHQIVGRGGRITDKIFKPFFKLIDLGGNVERFGSWSDDVNWHSKYKERIRQIVENYFICSNCQGFIKSNPCEECGHLKQAIKSDKIKEKTHLGIAVSKEKLPTPSPKMMVDFGLKTGKDINEIKNEVADYLVRMIAYNGMSYETYLNNAKRIDKRIKAIIEPIYFALHKSKLKGNRVRTILDFKRKVYKRIDKYYESERRCYTTKNSGLVSQELQKRFNF